MVLDLTYSFTSVSVLLTSVSRTPAFLYYRCRSTYYLRFPSSPPPPPPPPPPSLPPSVFHLILVFFSSIPSSYCRGFLHTIIPIFALFFVLYTSSNNNSIISVCVERQLSPRINSTVFSSSWLQNLTKTVKVLMHIKYVKKYLYIL